MNRVNIPKIDIVIPAYNAVDHIEECLDSIFASDFLDFRVTVVDDCSTDDTVTRSGNYSNVKILKNIENLGVSASRNSGIDHSQADIILLIDSDVMIPKDLLSQIIEFFHNNSDVSLIQARYSDTPYYKNLFSQYKHYVFAYRGLKPAPCNREYANRVHTACVAVRRGVVEKIRFNESLRRGEDGDFGQRCLQAGFRILSVPRLTVSHKKLYTFASFSRYQLRTSWELASQVFNKQTTGKVMPFYAKEDSLHKKLWLLRPVLSGLFLLNTLWLFSNYGQPLRWISIAFLFVLSFLLESGFRFYLLRVASIWVNLAAPILYFYDGLLLMIGIAQAVGHAMIHRQWMPVRNKLKNMNTLSKEGNSDPVPPKQGNQEIPIKRDLLDHDPGPVDKSGFCKQLCSSTDHRLEQT